jgi:hypothetical protein
VEALNLAGVGHRVVRRVLGGRGQSPRLGL